MAVGRFTGMEGIGDIATAFDALASAGAGEAATRAARFDQALSVMARIGRVRSRLEALQIDTLTELVDLADTQLPKGVSPGTARQHATDTDNTSAGGGGGDRWLGRAEIASIELGFELGISPGAAMGMIHDATAPPTRSPRPSGYYTKQGCGPRSSAPSPASPRAWSPSRQPASSGPPSSVGPIAATRYGALGSAAPSGGSPARPVWPIGGGSARGTGTCGSGTPGSMACPRCTG